MTRIVDLRPVRGRRLSEAEMITSSRVLFRRCLLPLAALAVGGLAVFTPMSSADAADGQADSTALARCIPARFGHAADERGVPQLAESPVLRRL
jgi:hypothetical protein